MRAYLFFVFLLLFSFGCKKGGGSHRVMIHGRVVNPSTGEGIPNIGIKVYRTASSGKVKSIESVRTDDQGNFEVNAFTSSRKGISMISEDAGTHLNVGWTNDGSTYFSKEIYTDISPGEQINATLHMVNIRDFYYRLENVNCSGPSDTLYFSTASVYLPPEAPYRIRKGCGAYQSFDGLFEGGIVVRMKVIRDGVVTEYEHIVQNETSPSSPAVFQY